MSSQSATFPPIHFSLRTAARRWYNFFRKKSARRTLYVVLLVCIPLGIFSYLTNPFVRFSIIIDPYQRVDVEQGQFRLQEDAALLVRHDAFFVRLAQLKSGWHILGNGLTGSKKAREATIDEIIREIHRLRFSAAEPYLISGDHFSVLYPRSLGIFYHSILDPRTALDHEDWRQRQLITLKTLAYALQVYRQSDRLSTTIVPVGPRSVALVNYYAPPSDTMYSILYALETLRSPDTLLRLYPFASEKVQTYQLETQQQVQELLTQYHDTLQGHFEGYLRQVYDPQTGLVREGIQLSGAKDIARRSSAFYDNVILWRTMQLAQELGIVEQDPQQLSDLKQRIVDRFWLPQEGYFLEDLSTQGIADRAYSSDWLIVQMTGFLDPSLPSERMYYERSVAYIQRNAIDKPFGLQYHPDERPYQRYPIAGWFAPSYGSTAIWSNWGMEYIKLLTRLAQETGDSVYLEQADAQLGAYAFNIKRYKGYPELYDKDGDFFRQTLYTSVRQTGWVVSYEQARAMFDAVRGSRSL